MATTFQVLPANKSLLPVLSLEQASEKIIMGKASKGIMGFLMQGRFLVMTHPPGKFVA